jgi:hypothetical protein
MNEYEQNIEIMKDLRDRIDAVLKDQPSSIGIALTEPLGIPDPVKHKYISFAKSAFRILAGAALCLGELQYAGGLFIFAEVLGIIEEMV